MSGYDSYSHYVDGNGRCNRTVYIPPDMEETIFLGTHQSDAPITIQCGKCGFSGPSEVRKQKGPANIVASVATLGLARKKAMETHHFCPGCNKDVAYSKPF